MLKKLLEHPLTRGLDLDDPKTSELRRTIIESKAFLRKLYTEWYELICTHAPGTSANNKILELGAGAGFFKSYCQKQYPSWQVVSSDVLDIEGIDAVLDARNLPYPNASFDAIIMTNVFHHIPDVEAFLQEASRILRGGGRLIMVEPWNTPFARIIYKYLHHEPFVTEVDSWVLPQNGGPLSCANDALPWIVFERDVSRFHTQFPELEIRNVEPLMPISYLLSGGVSLRSFLPGHIYEAIRLLEKRLPQKFCAMFAFIVVQKRN